MGYTKSFLVPFKYSQKVAYIVEFSHLKIRLFAKNQLVSEGGVDVASLDAELTKNDYPELIINSPYEYSDLWNDEDKCFGLQTIQHSDVLYIFNKNHPITMLKRYSNVDWRLEELEIKSGAYTYKHGIYTEATKIALENAERIREIGIRMECPLRVHFYTHTRRGVRRSRKKGS